MPGPSTSRRSRELAQADVDIGSFTKKEEIGRGSFATVYKAKHSVSGPYSLPPCSCPTAVQAEVLM